MCGLVGFCGMRTHTKFVVFSSLRFGTCSLSSQLSGLPGGLKHDSLQKLMLFRNLEHCNVDP